MGRIMNGAELLLCSGEPASEQGSGSSAGEFAVAAVTADAIDVVSALVSVRDGNDEISSPLVNV